MGECPQWYLVIKAAQYLGVAPWDLASKPVVWMRWAAAAQNAEEKERERRESRKNNTKG